MSDSLMNSNPSVSDRIRDLAARGHSRADIARMLGKRYQHVRNVLEADKLRKPTAGTARPSAGPVRTTPPDVEARATHHDAPPPTSGVYRLRLEADGSVRLPPAVQQVLGARAGAVLIAELEDDRLVILSGAEAARRAQSIVVSLGLAPERRLSEELIADRRREAAQDD